MLIWPSYWTGLYKIERVGLLFLNWFFIIAVVFMANISDSLTTLGSYHELPYMVLFALIAIFACKFLLNAFSLYGVEGAVKKIFDDFDINSEPKSTDAINDKSLFISSSIKNAKRAELSIISMVASILLFFLLKSINPLPDEHLFSSDLLSYSLSVASFSVFVVINTTSRIVLRCNEANKNISTVKYGDINESDVVFLKSIVPASDYLRAVSLSGREITRHELNMLMNIANETKRHENEKNIINMLKN